MNRLSLVLSAGWLLALFVLTGCARTVVNMPARTEAPDGPPATSTPERSAVLRELDGQAEMRVDAAAEWAPTSAGLILNVGNQLRTAADSRAYIHLTEGSKIRLTPETAVTLNLFNPFKDSLLTSLALDHGQVYVLLTPSSALDVETPVGLATARASYMSVAYDPDTQTVSVTCLQGTCGFESTLIPQRYKYQQTGQKPALPEPMSFADYGVWGLAVPEATELVAFATEAVAQGSATVPIAAVTETATPPPDTATPPPAPSDTAPAAEATTPAAEATATALPPSATPTPRPAATAVPQPTVPLLGQHRVLAGETVYCLARAYGVLPDAIIQVNGLPAPGLVTAGVVLRIPAVRWVNISDGPVCVPQFQSPYPGLPVPTETPAVTPVPAESPTLASPLMLNPVAALCIGNCDDAAASTYRLKIIVSTSGGAEPLSYSPGQQFELDFPRCTKAAGEVTVTSADGQVVTGSWVYDDPACTPAP
ncbi:MAG: FecR domain-containing protein [Anaerolineales bacterium]|nr:FecR domain-containing protein [Anaerolineales bacterium]